MRLSKAYIPTHKEIPSDAVIPSHRLMIRAGLIRPLAAGIYTYLPLGWRVMQNVMRIIREEMDRIDAQELHMPALNPIEIWDESGRNIAFGDEMFRLFDRKKHVMALAPTHEEIICDLARHFVKSYRDLPQIWYQIQTKFRDEPRPRSGVIRARQFFMKDSYSLDADEAGLNHSYHLHAEAYRRIFTRCGLQFYVVSASSGLMGGKVSQEFMLETPSGEDTLVLCTRCDYAANLEIATSIPTHNTFHPEPLKKVSTPDRRTIEEVAEFLARPKTQCMKALLYFAGEKPVMLLVRGDHQLNETKVQQALGVAVRPAHPEEIRDYCGAEAGFIGPIGTKKSVYLLADLALREHQALITGANEDHYHFQGIHLESHFSNLPFADIRNVEEGEACIQCGAPLRIAHALELGHIFKLGTKYSESMKATFLDRTGSLRPIVMGSYGIGVERIIAAFIEQNHDVDGIIWNKSLAPYWVHILALNMDKAPIHAYAERIYASLSETIPTLFDDRDVSAGIKFKDADLLGIPIQIIIGEKRLSKGHIEIRIRKTKETFVATEETLMTHILSWLDHMT